MTRQTTYDSPIGRLLLIEEDGYLKGLYFDRTAFNQDVVSIEESSVFMQTKKYLDQYFKGECPKILPPIKMDGTTFQKKVWKELLNIPYGQVVRYGDLSLTLFGHKKGSQAIGQAVHRNPISILVPCHRVISQSGIGGYAGGIERKKALLELEQSL